jgi:hypothetical protein
MSVVLLCAVSVSALAQSELAKKVEPQPLPDTTPLAITVLPAPVSKGATFQFVTITLTNTGDTTVRFPMPAIGCANAATGYVGLITDSHATVAPCAAGQAVPAAWQKWTVLKPGETANFGQMVTPLLPEGAATVQIRGVYTPPVLASSVQEELYRESVVYPTEALTSAPAEIVRDSAE